MANTEVPITPSAISRREPSFRRLAQRRSICSCTTIRRPDHCTSSRMRNLSRQPCLDIAKRTASPKETQSIPKDHFLQSEQLQDQLRVRIRDTESLDAQLLLHLQSGKLGRGFIHIR